MRYAYRHGPSRGTHVQTTHRYDAPAIPRVNLAGPVGWCQTCRDKDTPATQEATWRDPATGKCYDVVVCDECARCKEVT